VNFESFCTYLLTEKRCSPHTLEAYKSDLLQFEAFCLRTFEVTSELEVSQTMVRTWLADLMAESYQASSVHRKLSSLQAYFRFLLREGSIQVSPVKGIAKPKLPKRLPTFVDEKGALQLYDIEKDNDFFSVRDGLIVTLFYETGIRLSELMNLKDHDIDFSLYQIKVLGKRNKMRLVPVSNEFLNRAKKYMQQREEEFGLIHDDHFFVSNKGKKIAKSFVYTRVKHYLSSVTTLKKKSPHVLRHTFATHMLNNGADLNVIKEILGHSSLAATQVYTHNSIEKLKGIHSKMHPRNN
jgi:integrase/recombinase XerC